MFRPLSNSQLDSSSYQSPREQIKLNIAFYSKIYTLLLGRNRKEVNNKKAKVTYVMAQEGYISTKEGKMRARFCIISALAMLGLVHAQPNWVAFTPGSAPGTAPIVEVLASDSLHTTAHITIPGMWVRDTSVNNTTYQILEIPAHGTNHNVGEPQMPTIYELVAIPPTSNANITINNTVALLQLNGYNVFPYQEPVPEGQLPDSFFINNTLYNTNVSYPSISACLSDPAVWRDVRVAQTTLYPIKFNPVTHQLDVWYDFTAQIDYSGTSNVNILPNGYPEGIGPEYAAMYSNAIINYDWLGLEEDESRNSYAYLIITTDEFEDVIQPFVFWKHKKGFEVLVKTSSTSWTTQSVKDTILADYNARQTDWVLLVGDTADVPIKNTSYGYSDYWYSLLAGNDHYPELAVGRFSPADTTDVTTMVNKTFAYERYPNPSWDIDDVLLVVAMNCLDSYACKEFIKLNVMQSINFNVDTAYAMDTTINGDPLYRYATNDTVSRYIEQAGGVSIVNYRGHGHPYQWQGDGRGWSSTGEVFDTADVWDLDNFWASDSGWLPLVFNVCCNTGAIQYPECMVEAWTRSPNGGAAGAMGATGITSFPVSNPMDTILFLTMFGIGQLKRIYYVGDAINYAKSWVIQNPPIDTTYVNMTVYRHLWAGDPSLWVWTDSSGALTELEVSHASRIYTDSTAFTVTVRADQGGAVGPLKNAYVCLYKESDIYERGYTDSNGRITFYIDPLTTGTLYVTVTSHHCENDYYQNYLPYEGTCSVQQGPGG